MQGLKVISYSVLVVLVLLLNYGCVSAQEGVNSPPGLFVVLFVTTIYFFWRLIMATLDKSVNVVEDFSDLGQPFKFKYLDDTFIIPPIVPSKAKKLINSARAISKQAEEKEKKIKELQEKNEEIPASLLEGSDDIFDFQIDFIIQAGLKKETAEGTLIDTKRKDLEDNWSTQLVLRIFKRVNEIIMTEQEKKS
jgi:hypothetical protein